MKKLLALVLALVMTLSLAVVGSNAAFKDAKDVNETYSEAVDVLSGMGVFNGYKNADGTYSFQPKGDITRAEVAAIVYRLYTADVTDKQASLYATYNKFSDMNGAAWAAGYIGYCANAGLIKGYDAKTFGPSDKVTGYQALAMILRAVGYDKNNEFTGADWQLHVAQTAQQLGILKNVKGVDLNAAASRELVAELLFRTAAYVPMVTYTPALGYTNLTAILNGKANATLGEKNFGLTKNADTQDDWGRPYYTWTNGKTGTLKVTYATVKATPVATYYVATSECDIASALGLKKTTPVATWVNANKAADTSINPVNTLNKIGAQGRTIEVYEDRLVIVDTFLAKVDKVAPAEYDTAGHLKATGNYTTITVYDKAAGTQVTLKKDVLDAVKGDYILVNFKTTSVAIDVIDTAKASTGELVYNVIGKAESFTGAQTNIWINAGKHTVDGTEYADAVQFHLNDAGNTAYTTFTWFKDTQGNLIGAAKVAAQYTYAVLKDLNWTLGTPGYAVATLIDAATGAESTATVYSIDGTQTSVWDAKDAVPTANLTLGATGASFKTGTPNVAYVGPDSSVNGIYNGYALYRVSTLSTGAVVLEGVDNTVGQVEKTVSNHVTGTTVGTNGNSFKNDVNQFVPVNDNTVFTVKTESTVNGTKTISYTQYTGKANVPSMKNCELFYVMDADNVYAQYVYIKSGTPINAIEGSFVMAVDTSVITMNDSVTTWDYLGNAYINGVLQTSPVIKAVATTSSGVTTSAVRTLATNYNAPYYVTFNDDGTVNTIAAFGDSAVPVGNNVSYRKLDSSKVTGSTASTLVVNGSTYGYSTADTKIVGTDIATAEANGWSNYNVYAVYTTDTYGWKSLTQLYIISKDAGSTVTPVDPSKTAVINYKVKVIDTANNTVVELDAATDVHTTAVDTTVSYADLITAMQTNPAGFTTNKDTLAYLTAQNLLNAASLDQKVEVELGHSVPVVFTIAK